jgi:hypothetical protein
MSPRLWRDTGSVIAVPQEWHEDCPQIRKKAMITLSWLVTHGLHRFELKLELVVAAALPSMLPDYHITRNRPVSTNIDLDRQNTSKTPSINRFSIDQDQSR